jgi:hypothetical protein
MPIVSAWRGMYLTLLAVNYVGNEEEEVRFLVNKGLSFLTPRKLLPTLARLCSLAFDNFER